MIEVCLLHYVWLGIIQKFYSFINHRSGLWIPLNKWKHNIDGLALTFIDNRSRFKVIIANQLILIEGNLAKRTPNANHAQGVDITDKAELIRPIIISGERKSSNVVVSKVEWVDVAILSSWNIGANPTSVNLATPFFNMTLEGLRFQWAMLALWRCWSPYPICLKMLRWSTVRRADSSDSWPSSV